jgi:ectoine hydroxylase-related dioxygenase (phytanoyl-CoA dioxygenase family)
MGFFRITDEEFQKYNEEGFIIVRSLFHAEEMKLLREAVTEDKHMAEAAYEVKDKDGGTAKIAIWQGAGDDLYGLVARSERVVNTMERLLAGEVYHWHSKMTIKVPHTGGAWEWHQDYGYWYEYGCLFPLLSSCMIAVDKATKENGCLQVLKRSHKLGRIDHGKAGSQAGADPERLAVAVKTFENVDCELEVGDAVFFHCNTLHGSGQNHSPNPRRAFLCCYNAKRNSPYKVVRHPEYTPLVKVPDTAILEAGLRIADQEYGRKGHYQLVQTQDSK